VIAVELVAPPPSASPDENVPPLDRYEERIEAIYREAMAASARNLGLREEQILVAEGAASFSVTLVNPAGNKILLLPLVKYRLARAVNPNAEPEFITFSSGQEAQLLGYYEYKIQLPDGQTTQPAWISVDRDGELKLE
jgi:hypothetical protein